MKSSPDDSFGTAQSRGPDKDQTRGGVAPIETHNLDVAGSNPAPATNIAILEAEAENDKGQR
jgi:hypothetical protein